VNAIDAGLTYAYQPIVNVHTGETWGFEALLRGTDLAGFASIPAFFADVHERDATLETEAALMRLAVEGFVSFAAGAPVRLFFNVNDRALDDPAHHVALREVVRSHALPSARFGLDLSERGGLSLAHARELALWSDRPLLAIDDFGTGAAGLRLLAESHPDIVKIDRTFIAGIDASQAKHAFLGQIVGLAHASGVLVIAEGVETEGSTAARVTTVATSAPPTNCARSSIPSRRCRSKRRWRRCSTRSGSIARGRFFRSSTSASNRSASCTKRSSRS
jgi:EAL domain-containing protein (putative c-di-GMP-specific phosphodiesterase class I)